MDYIQLTGTEFMECSCGCKAGLISVWDNGEEVKAAYLHELSCPRCGRKVKKEKNETKSGDQNYVGSCDLTNNRVSCRNYIVSQL